MGSWRTVIGHDGYVVARLHLLTPEGGGRSRAVQSGYRADWWHAGETDESWVGEAPLDVIGDRPRIMPGTDGTVHLHPMDPSQWSGIRAGAVLHMREKVTKTLGVAVVEDIVDVPEHAPLRVDPQERVRGVILTADNPSAVTRLLRRARRLLWFATHRRR